MIDFALNHMTVPRANWCTLIDVAARLGCTGVEVRNDLGKPLFDGREPSEAGAMARDEGLRIHTVAEIKQFDAWDRDRALEARSLVRVAAAAGAEAVCLIPRNDGAGIGDGERQANVRAALRGIGPMLEDAGIAGLVEPLGFETSANLGPFSILDYRGMREATLAGLEKTAVKIPNIRNTIRNMSGGQRQCVAIARTATFHSKLTIMDEPTAALGVQETIQVENIIKTLKAQGEPLILISHNMRQVFDLVDRIVVFRRGRVVANLNRDETDPQDVVAYITWAKTGEEFAGAA